MKRWKSRKLGSESNFPDTFSVSDALQGKFDSDPDSHAVLPGVHYLTDAESARLDAHSLLGLICYGNCAPSRAAAPYPRAEIAMSPVDGAPRVEAWTSTRPVTAGRSGDVQFAHDGESLFALVSVSADAGFETTVTRAYQALVSAVRKMGYPHFHRIWNYFPHILASDGELDRYRVFCRGRHEALARAYGEFDNLLPAASAVGTHDGDPVIYALASRVPGTPRENPRQISAYRYPPQYGPRSPAFARATLAPGRERLYISGTASIVGHASQHERDARAQLDETLANLDALIGATDAAEGTGFGGLSSLSHAKVYLRDPAFYPWVREALADRLARDCQTLYLRGDICRGELLLEIEAIAQQKWVGLQADMSG